MRKIPDKTSKTTLPNMSILERYEVPPHAYGYCPKCNTFFDYWVYGDTEYLCPYDCGTLLKELNAVDLAMALVDCEEDKCFEQEFLYSTPLKPIPKKPRDNT